MKPTISIRGKIYTFDTPKVMGIINATPDSFFAKSRVSDAFSLTNRVSEMVRESVDIFDIGAFSSRPGASEITADEEYDRLAPVLEITRKIASEIPISVDTFRASIAQKCIDNFDVDIINDISGGNLDPEIKYVVAESKKAYILMHSRGNPATMQSLTSYNNLVADIISELAFKIADLRQLGVADIIVDPGFGFAKTISQNFSLLDHLSDFKILNCPLLSAISRKSMIWKTLDSSPEEALNGTTVLNTVSLMNGADIIRVHDVAAAKECVTLFSRLKNSDS